MNKVEVLLYVSTHFNGAEFQTGHKSQAATCFVSHKVISCTVVSHNVLNRNVVRHKVVNHKVISCKVIAIKS